MTTKSLTPNSTPPTTRIAHVFDSKPQTPPNAPALPRPQLQPRCTRNAPKHIAAILPLHPATLTMTILTTTITGVVTNINPSVLHPPSHPSHQTPTGALHHFLPMSPLESPSSMLSQMTKVLPTGRVSTANLFTFTRLRNQALSGNSSR